MAAPLFTFTYILVATLLFLNHYGQARSNHKTKLTTTTAILSKLNKWKFPPSSRPTPKNSTHTLLIILLLAGDIELNPGPGIRTRGPKSPKLKNSEFFPCALCDRPVNWSDQGVCCDECSMWHHKSCIELCSKDFSLLNRSNISWLCCKCEYTNLSSFTFHSYSIGSDSYYNPIMDESIDGSIKSVFSPLKASTPEHSGSRNKTTEPGLNTSNYQPSMGSEHHNSLFKPPNYLSESIPYDLPKKQNLRIMNVNAQSIRGKTAEFAALLDYCKPDIVCCTESWLTGKKPGENANINAIKDSEVFPKNYKAFRNDRNMAGGGVFILAKENLIAVEQPVFVTDCEIIWIKIHLKGRKELFIGCFYMPHRNQKDLLQLEESLDKLNSHKDKQFILCGDFNCPGIDWSSLTLNNTCADKQIQQQLLDLSNKFGLTQTVQEETREKNTLDLIFTTNPSLVISTSTIPGISDHDITIVDCIIRPHYQKPQSKKIFNFNKADWTGLKEKCLTIASEIATKYSQNCNIEELWSLFKTNLLASTDQHIPSKTVTNKCSPPWLSKKLRKMSKKKARLHKQAKKSGNRSNYRFFQKECKRAYKKAEVDYINTNILNGLQNNNTKPFWKYVKSKKQDNIGVSPLLEKGSLIVDSKGKAELLLKQFVSVFTPPSDNEMPSIQENYRNPLETITVTNKGVLNLMKSINIFKAPGPDQIPSKVLKECADELAPAVTCLFQRSLDTGMLPDDWTNANVAPIYKKGDKHRAENYRPVSLTSVMSKLLEHIVCCNMMKHFEENKILTSLNHGFRTGYSCETQLAITIDDLTRNYDKDLQTDIAILDFSKAFDTVPHNKLLHKLNAYGIKGPLHKWIHSFLCNRRMKVVTEGVQSSEAKVTSGVPQGTVLGPILFLCHINNLPEAVSSSVRLFADDCLLYRPIKNQGDHQKLQEDLKSLQKWADDWGMRFNASKCYILSIRNKSSHFYELNNTILKEVPTNPYLGIMISNDLKWNTHINNVCGKASSTLGFIKRNLQYSPSQTRHAAYISLVRSTLEYAATIWDPHTQSEIDKLEKVQRRAARFISKDYKSRETGCVRKMLESHNLPPLQQRRKDLRLTLFFKVATGMLPAIPPDQYLEPIRNKRKIKATQFQDCVTRNVVQSYQIRNSQCYRPSCAKTDIYRNSFFVRTTVDWNQLEDSHVTATSLDSFKASLQRNRP